MLILISYFQNIQIWPGNGSSNQCFPYYLIMTRVSESNVFFLRQDSMQEPELLSTEAQMAQRHKAFRPPGKFSLKWSLWNFSYLFSSWKGRFFSCLFLNIKTRYYYCVPLCPEWQISFHQVFLEQHWGLSHC